MSDDGGPKRRQIATQGAWKRSCSFARATRNPASTRNESATSIRIPVPEHLAKVRSGGNPFRLHRTDPARCQVVERLAFRRHELAVDQVTNQVGWRSPGST